MLFLGVQSRPARTGGGEWTITPFAAAMSVGKLPPWSLSLENAGRDRIIRSA